MPLTKDEKKLIEDEERRFQKILESLCAELPEAQASKVSANQLAREMTRRVTTEWNSEERQPLVSDEAVAHEVFGIRKNSDQVLMELIQEPYFGRVITTEEDGSEVEFLVGKKGNINSGIVDWRNGPVSALYFNYRQGEEFFEVINDRERAGRIKLRRSYKIQEGRLLQIDAPEGVFLRGENEWDKLDPEAEMAAHRSRGIHARDKRLPSILSLITREQFQLITTDPHRPVVIQGSAGSGKTTVALHRLAWLLHADNSRVRPQNTRVMVMNKSLQIYVSSTLPALGISEVETTTFTGWALSIIRRATRGRAQFQFRNLPAFVEEIKFSEGMLQAISAYVDRQADHVDRAVQTQLPAGSSLREIWGRSRPRPVVVRVQEILHEARSASLPRSQKKKVLEFLKPLVEDLEDYVQDVDRLLQDAGFLEPFLDPHPKRREHLDYLKRLSQRNHQEKTLDYFDLSILLRIIQLKTGGLPGRHGEPMVFDHLVIDEAQDFGPLEFAVMLGTVKDKRQLTIVGDVSQKILFSRKFLGWERIFQSLGLDPANLIRLEVSYRCTAPIMTLARTVEGSPKEMEGRPGPLPRWQRAENRDALLDTLADWTRALREKDPWSLVALLCRHPKQAMELKEDLQEMIPEGLRLGHRDRFSFEPGVIVTNVHQVKGLEFDAVALVEPSEQDYPSRNPQSRNLLYVAITRAQDELLLAGVQPFSRVLFAK